MANHKVATVTPINAAAEQDPIQAAYARELQSRREAFEAAAGPHGKALADHAALKAKADLAEQDARTAREAEQAYLKQPAVVTAMQVAGDALQPVKQLESAGRFLALFKVLSRYNLAAVPASALTGLYRVPVIGDAIKKEIASLYPSSSANRDTARITVKVAAEIDGAIRILASLQQ